MVRRFSSQTPEAIARGQELFRFMRSLLDSRVQVVKENWALLIEEALDVTMVRPMKSMFRGETEYLRTYDEIDKLCKGNSSEAIAAFVGSRRQASESSRQEIKKALKRTPASAEFLRSINRDALPRFLGTAATGGPGRALLAKHLLNEFPSNSPHEAQTVATLLLNSRKYRLSRSMVRADLYLNWRCAHRESLRADLPDDTFHVVSASYCDFFLTTERDQSEIATLALEGITAAHHDGVESALDWISTAIETK